jgi:hypothetical protein
MGHNLLLSQAFWWESLWRWDLGHNLLLSQAFWWESLWRWDLGHNLLLSQAFQWESVWLWDLRHNLFLSHAFRWESLWRWDLGFCGALGYQGASFSKRFFLFLNLGYHGALLKLSWILYHDGIRAITEPFSHFHKFFSHDGIQDIAEPFSHFHGFFLMMGSRLSRSLSHTFTDFFSWWNSGYHGAFPTLSFHDGTSAITEPSHTFFSRWNFGYHGAFSRTFLFIRWNFARHTFWGKTLFIYITKNIYIGSASLKTLPIDLEPPLQGKEYNPPYSKLSAKFKCFCSWNHL